MITENDIDYKETKAILNEKKETSEQIAKLKVWIENQYGIKVLHIVQDFLDTLNKERLNVVLENDDDVDKFKDKNTNYDSLKQSLISEKFAQINGKVSNKKSFLKRLFEKPKDEYFVCFSAYNPIAKSEILSKLPDEIMSEFKKRNTTKNVWEIHDTFMGAIVFLFREDDIAEYKNSGQIERLKDDFFEMVKPYDKNGYFERDKLNIGIDSKENFDNNYESNWYHYYK